MPPPAQSQRQTISALHLICIARYLFSLLQKASALCHQKHICVHGVSHEATCPNSSGQNPSRQVNSLSQSGDLKITHVPEACMDVST